MRVLFLTPWYPSEADAMSGLFVQKHVEAVRSQGVDVRVIHSQGWREMWRQWRELRHEGWIPNLVQLNVIQKQGALAMWLKKVLGIPYIIVEHFSGYLPENGQFGRMNGWRKKFYRRIAAEAEMILPVSRKLLDAMHRCRIPGAAWFIMPNVVDDFFYEPSAVSIQHSDKKTLLHVSCFDEQAKNTSAILRGFQVLCERRADVRLVMVGTGVDLQESRQLAKRLAIPEDRIVWTGELTPEQVSEWMHQADALVLSSRYETYGVVLAEAAAAGLPILSTPVGIAQEVINEQTGIIVSQENVNRPKRFSEYMEHVLSLSHYPSQAAECKASSVGKRLLSIYRQCTD